MNQKSPENNLTLPLLITRGLVVFPNMSEEIEASRPFSVAAIKDAKEMTNSLIFVVAQKTPDVDNPNEEDIYDVGTLCRIVSYADNGSSMRIRLIGSKRVKFLKTVLGENPSAEGTFLENVSGDASELEGLVKKLLESLSSTPEISRGIPRSAINQLGKGVSSEDIPDTFAGYLPLSTDQRQSILAEPNVNKRLQLLLNILSSLRQMAEVESSISEKVRVSTEKSQKEYYLREKMKAIKEELGEGGSSSNDEDSIKEKLEKNPYPENVKARVKQELHRYEMMPESSLEASLIMSYIETLMNVPWYQKSEDDEDLGHVREVLDEDHFGLEKVKKRIIEYLAV